MESPRSERVRVDAQGRMVLPRRLRDELVRVPGEVLAHRTADGVLLTPAERPGAVGVGADGLPLLTVGRPVTNADVLAALELERADR